ncbi:hypothetical protein BCR43DRAFT_495235 [Syncephalastrum racemosum]|uniref:Uncharacterized protein n=1 Tax=Syncephalastrum racemosum TaxID=13706 RepID=A0A1X2H5K4_SYNRA|nr:hypothetical protein BCR43DRAFT_495235 [Syncephalastrum racemosum]
MPPGIHGYEVVRCFITKNQRCSALSRPRGCIPHQREDEQEGLRILRIKHCLRCRKYFHRDGIAAHSNAHIWSSMLVHGQRPGCFISPARKLNTSSRKRSVAEGSSRSDKRIRR